MRFQFVEPAEDFSDGLKVLYSYHEQFLKRGRELLDLVDRIQSDGMTEEHAYQCVHLHCYYQRANPLHHQDEERVLFPLIVHRSFLVDGMIERLALDHQEIEEAWDELARIIGCPEQIADREKLKQRVLAFEKLQRQHVTRENEDFFPAIEEWLSPEQRTETGKEMASMRVLRRS
ncbi:MAG: hemerythrin domain-containing protein [Gammaproteobacteria bacterium]